jgi:hypothetical protein
MAGINLLPSDYSKKTGAGKALDFTQKSLLYVSLIFVLFLTASILGILITNQRLKTEKAAESGLVSEIKSLEDVEQKLYLTVDRIQKYKEISKQNDNKLAIEKFASVSDLTDDQVDISEAEIVSNGSEITVTAQSSKSLAEFLAKLTSSDIYKDLSIKI